VATPTASRPGSRIGANGGSTDSTAAAVPAGSVASSAVLSANTTARPPNSQPSSGRRPADRVAGTASRAKPSTYQSSPVPNAVSTDPGTDTTPVASATTVPSTPIAARCASPVTPRPDRLPSNRFRGRSTVSRTSVVPVRASSVSRRAASPADSASASVTRRPATTPTAIRWCRFGSVALSRVRLICAWSTLDSTSCGRTPNCAICASSTCWRTRPFSVVRSCGSSWLSTVTCNAARAPDTNTSNWPARTAATPSDTLSTWLTATVTPRLAVSCGSPSASAMACPASPTRTGRTWPNTNACRNRKTTSNTATATEPTSTRRDHTRPRNSRRATMSTVRFTAPPRRTGRRATGAAG
jgi:hypothetical protein